MKTVYFKTEQQIREYYRASGLPYVDNAISNAKKEDLIAYYDQFKEIDGCSIAFCLEEFIWHELYMCIIWKGTAMRVPDYYDEGTHELVLCDSIDWQGLNKFKCNYSIRETLEKPRKIGKPTASKLDQWREYLLNDRNEELKRRDYTFAYMLAKIDEVCAAFPEARNVEWKNGVWEFKKESNGIEYVVNIYSDGNIYEDYKLSYELADYPISPAEKAMRLMANAMQYARRCANSREASAVRDEDKQKRVEKFMGGRPIVNY